MTSQDQHLQARTSPIKIHVAFPTPFLSLQQARRRAMARAGGSRPRCATDHRRRRNEGLESVGPRSGGALCSADFGPGQLRSQKDTLKLDLDLFKKIWLGNVGQIMTSYSGWNRVVP